MSIPFKQLKTKLGLDDKLDFGKYQGLTVLQCIQERNGYIDWLILKGKKFYPSIYQELKRNPFVDPGPKGDRGRKLRHYTDDYDHDLLGDWFEDVPF
jgi:hypothetical protein